MRGLGGNDQIQGSGLNDQLDGGPGNDIVVGERGNDDFMYRRGDGNGVISAASNGDADYADRLIFGPGIYRADLTFTRGATNDVKITIAGGGQVLLSGQMASSTIDYILFDDGTVLDMEKVLVPVTGTSGADRLFGDNPNTVRARDGALVSDVISGLGGNDTISAGHGLNLVLAGGGNDVVTGGRHADSLDGGTGNDTLTGGESEDTLLGQAGDDDLRGQDSDDLITAANGNDTASGGWGEEVITGDAGNDRLEGEGNDDLLDGGIGFDSLFGGGGRDSLLGDEGNDVFSGGSDSDILMGEGGGDILDGGTHDDVIDGGSGNDLLSGGSGRDRFMFSRTSGQDEISDFDLRYDIMVLPTGALVRQLQSADGLLLTLDTASVLLEGVRPGIFRDPSFEYA